MKGFIKSTVDDKVLKSGNLTTNDSSLVSSVQLPKRASSKLSTPEGIEKSMTSKSTENLK